MTKLGIIVHNVLRFLAVLLIGVLLGTFYHQPIMRWLTGSYLVNLHFLDTSTAIEATPAQYQSLSKPFWQAWGLIEQNHYSAPIDKSLMIHRAIKGLVTATNDPYSRYLTPVERAIADEDMSDEYVGIGVYIDVRKAYPSITGVMPDSPAAVAGLRVGDVLVAVNGQDIHALDPIVVITMVRGKPNTRVMLGILRGERAERIDLAIVRQRVDRPMMISKWLANRIYCIKLHRFGVGVGGQVHADLLTAIKQNPNGIILDVRGNPGGSRDEVLRVISEFINSGVLMIERYADGKQVIHKAKLGGLALKIPLIVLVDGLSASAAEVLAASIQDHKRGKIVGTETYGKGSVQAGFDLENDSGRLMISYALWLTPTHQNLSKRGVIPDVIVDSAQSDPDEVLLMAQRMFSS